MSMDHSDEDKLFSSDDDNIKVNASNSALTRQTPSGKKRKNRGLLNLDLSSTFNAVISFNSQLATLRTVKVNAPHIQVIVTSVTSHSKESTLDLDSFYDTCVSCANALVVQDHGRPVNVLTYNPVLGDRTYKKVSGVIRYNHPITGQRYHLVIQQAISIPHLEHHFLCNMQARVNDVTINEIPKFLASNLTIDTHSIIVTDLYDPA